MAELFGVDVRTVSEHLRNIYDSGELAEEATLRKFRMVRTEGNREVSREVSVYEGIMITEEFEYACARIARAVEDLDDRIGMLIAHTQRIADAAESMTGEGERLAATRHRRDLAQIAAALNVESSAVDADLVVGKVVDLHAELAAALDLPESAVVQSVQRALGLDLKRGEMSWRDALAAVCKMRAERDGLLRRVAELEAREIQQ